MAQQDSYDAASDVADADYFTGVRAGVTVRFLWSTVKSKITKALVGLGNVDNYSALDMPISTATAAALLAKQASSAKGQASGFASLGVDAKLIDAELGATLAALKALTTTSYGRSFLNVADAAAARTYIGLDSVLGAVEYKGAWNASTNSPNLSAASPAQGDYYVVSVAGSTSLGGITDWGAGDWAIYNGAAWQKVDNTDAIASVFGRTGVVTAQSGDYSAFYQALSAILTSIAAISGNGILARTAAGAATSRTISGTSNQVTIADGDGVAGNPTVSLPNGLILPGAVGFALRSITSARTLDATDYTILGDATGAAFTVTLPAVASNAGRVYIVKKIDASANSLTIDGNASETIDGAATLDLTAQWAHVMIQSSGTAWSVIG